MADDTAAQRQALVDALAALQGKSKQFKNAKHRTDMPVGALAHAQFYAQYGAEGWAALQVARMLLKEIDAIDHPDGNTN